MFGTTNQVSDYTVVFKVLVTPNSGGEMPYFVRARNKAEAVDKARDAHTARFGLRRRIRQILDVVEW